MTYLKVKWIHTIPQEPVWLYSELDDARWEIRKVEVFMDGRAGYADAQSSAGGTGLSKEPIPSVAEVAADPQFEATEITEAEFERIWAGRRGGSVA